MTSCHGPLDPADLQGRVHTHLTAFLAAQNPRLAAISEAMGPVAEALQEFVLDGGKRLRPAFLYWGWRGAGAPDSEQILKAASCLELLHACALIHDDVMDGSDTRRGRPSVHRRFAALHRVESWRGHPEAFGTAAAILLGDLCLVWADQLLDECGLDQESLRRGRPVFDEMRTELMAGQYLDLLEQATGGTGVDGALRVARYKTAKYTIERPLHLGGVLAGADIALLEAYSAYGIPLGEAFQLRDDVLGVFGDPEVTGKPAGDDLREGKCTALVAAASVRADPGQAAALRRLVGDPLLDEQGVTRLRAVITDTGALAEVEAMIAMKLAECRACLDRIELPAEARSALAALAEAATSRRV